MQHKQSCIVFLCLGMISCYILGHLGCWYSGTPSILRYCVDWPTAFSRSEALSNEKIWYICIRNIALWSPESGCNTTWLHCLVNLHEVSFSFIFSLIYYFYFLVLCNLNRQMFNDFYCLL